LCRARLGANNFLELADMRMSADAGQVEMLRVADELAIQRVLAVHCRAVDRADESMLKSAYWTDAEVEYGGFNGPAHVFCEALPVSVRRFARTQHSISNVLVTFMSDTQARVETYVNAYHYLAVEGGTDTEMTYLGRYLDQFEKRSGTWKIQHRKVVMDWNQNFDATAIWDGPPFDGLARGERTPNDPLDEFLDASKA